ncbi:MAG: hypothetical protein B6I20_07215 [Bacteroidetes bacterium 4572_117]|nr:MAG: hypothetical protein B6I20_07215 [Bacteroidetes bacterium 4572_117]
MNELTPFTKQALSILRDPSTLQWYVIPLLALSLYIYANEMERKNWNLVFAGLAFWGMDWINEIINSLILHFTDFAPLWCAPGKTAYLILVGLNIEIAFMFSIAGIVWAKMLPNDKNLKILGINNRLFIAITGSVFSVVIEIFLNMADMLTWDYSWWNINVPWLIIIFGYLTFFIVAFWVYDMKTMKQKVVTVGVIYTIVLFSFVVFGSLGWL